MCRVSEETVSVGILRQSIPKLTLDVVTSVCVSLRLHFGCAVFMRRVSRVTCVVLCYETTLTTVLVFATKQSLMPSGQRS